MNGPWATTTGLHPSQNPNTGKEVVEICQKPLPMTLCAAHPVRGWGRLVLAAPKKVAMRRSSCVSHVLRGSLYSPSSWPNAQQISALVRYDQGGSRPLFSRRAAPQPVVRQSTTTIENSTSTRVYYDRCYSEPHTGAIVGQCCQAEAEAQGYEV
jgi:hypothetical protein